MLMALLLQQPMALRRVEFPTGVLLWVLLLLPTLMVAIRGIDGAPPLQQQEKQGPRNSRSKENRSAPSSTSSRNNTSRAVQASKKAGGNSASRESDSKIAEWYNRFPLGITGNRIAFEGEKIVEKGVSRVIEGQAACYAKIYEHKTAPFLRTSSDNAALHEKPKIQNFLDVRMKNLGLMESIVHSPFVEGLAAPIGNLEMLPVFKRFLINHGMLFSGFTSAYIVLLDRLAKSEPEWAALKIATLARTSDGNNLISTEMTLLEFVSGMTISSGEVIRLNKDHYSTFLNIDVMTSALKSNTPWGDFVDELIKSAALAPNPLTLLAYDIAFSWSNMLAGRCLLEHMRIDSAKEGSEGMEAAKKNFVYLYVDFITKNMINDPAKARIIIADSLQQLVNTVREEELPKGVSVHSLKQELGNAFVEALGMVKKMWLDPANRDFTPLATSSSTHPAAADQPKQDE